jgi:hypothetical protein
MELVQHLIQRGAPFSVAARAKEIIETGDFSAPSWTLSVVSGADSSPPHLLTPLGLNPGLRVVANKRIPRDVCYVLLYSWQGAIEQVRGLSLTTALKQWLLENPSEQNASAADLWSQVPSKPIWSHVEVLPGHPQRPLVLDGTLLGVRHSDTANLKTIFLDDAAVVWSGLLVSLFFISYLLSLRAVRGG